MSFQQYGLSSIDAGGADHDKGIVAGPDGKFYQIDGFKRNKKDGLDKDAGAVFGGELEAAGREAGFDPTTFNTATDVENALKAIGGGGGAPTENQGFMPEKDVEYSPEMQEAKDRVQRWEETNGRTGEAYGDGSRANPGEVDYEDMSTFKVNKKSVK